ncbi:secretogranin-1 [Hippopotamus amphibius kiboko]|uniref:secretogranin-1 n=1 Tax=Hippopotamus amphibius kiboko TaxID=575201 RepID=UPI0025964E02|nr:secretogranin-1 [Hippopotamus amphibius kiboko]
MQLAVLLGLVGAAMLAAVTSMPVDIRTHNEEMVTRCIIEVLSNALTHTPPITPECRQVLKKSGKELKDEEKSANENTRFEVRLLRDPADASLVPGPSGRKDTGEEDAQGPTVADTEGGGHSRERAREPQGSRVAEEAKIRYSYSEKSEGQDGEEEEAEKYQKRERGEGSHEERRLEGPGEAQTAFLNQRNQTPAKKEEFVSRYDAQSARGPETSHSRERSSQESGEEAGSREDRPGEPQSRPEGQGGPEDSEEDASPEVDKRRSRPRHHHGRSRPDRASQQGNPPPEGRGQPWEEPPVGTAGEEVRGPGDLDGARYEGRGPEAHRAPRPPREEEGPEPAARRSSLSPEPDGLAQGAREAREGDRGLEAGALRSALGGQPAAYPSLHRAEEKRFLGEAHRRAQGSQTDKARRHPQGELRSYLDDGEEEGEKGAQGKWPQNAEENREDARLRGTPYAPHHIPEKKRAGELRNPYYEPPQWRSTRSERKDHVHDNFLEGEEENGLTLNEKNFFPEYNYDWWEKKPFEEDVDWANEKRNLAPKLDLKRQYDRVAKLDQLLHYRKKSAEFPDFYDSEEPMSPHHAADNEEERAGQGVLTEEEEKELENLAAMDLELQKIAEKFSGNRRG